MEHPPKTGLKVIALRYQSQEDRAPKIAAKGRGHMAERILETAKAYNIPVREDKNLVEVLSHLDLEQEIPPEVYKVVAEILAFVYRLTSHNSPPPSSCPL
jgi:flagellar biosynthesis protein